MWKRYGPLTPLPTTTGNRSETCAFNRPVFPRNALLRARHDKKTAKTPVDVIFPRDRVQNMAGIEKAILLYRASVKNVFRVRVYHAGLKKANSYHLEHTLGRDQEVGSLGGGLEAEAPDQHFIGRNRRLFQGRLQHAAGENLPEIGAPFFGAFVSHAFESRGQKGVSQ